MISAVLAKLLTSTPTSRKTGMAYFHVLKAGRASENSVDVR